MQLMHLQRGFSLMVSFGLALALLATTGCPPRMVIIDGQEMPYELAATTAFERARNAHLEERHEEAIERLRDYLAQFGRGDHVEEARWLLGSSYLALDRDSDAARAFQTLIDSHPRSSYATPARVELGRLHLGLHDYVKAMHVLEPAYERLRGEPRLAVAQMLTEASLGLERWTDAVYWIGEARRLAPDERAREAADQELLELIDTKVPPPGLAQLRKTLAADSPALPLVVMKIARLHFHKREYSLARDALDDYLRRWPQAHHAADARQLREWIASLAEVRPTVVGVILPLSGRAKPFGDAVLRGMGMALDVRGHEITLVIRDSEGDPALAAEAVEELVLREKAVAIIGPLLSGTSLSAAAKAEELGVPLISLTRAEGLTELGSWVFRNALSDAAQAKTLVDYAVEHLGAQSFGILYPNHDFGRSLMNHFWNEVEKRQLEVRGVERYDHDETTFQPIVRRLVGRHFLQYRPEYTHEVRRIRAEVTDPVRRRRALARALDSVVPLPEFEVLFVPDSYRNVGLIAPALAVEDVITNVCDTRDIERIKETTGRDELTKVVLLGPNSWHHPELVTRGGRHIRCSVFVDGFFADSRRGQTRAFVEMYRQIHGPDARPDYLEAHGFDTAGIVRHIIEELRPRDRQAFREALIGLKGYPGATGETRFRPDGEVDKPMFLLTVDREEIIEIDLGGEAEAPEG